ncbi:MAG: hypothetical protein H5U02_11555 [Clostridia bacterium]|nr:hypothetical protein [Clostridia bacterium]
MLKRIAKVAVTAVAVALVLVGMGGCSRANQYDSLANDATGYVYKQYVEGQAVDADTAYILSLAGDGITVDQWVYKDKTLKETVIASIDKTLQNPALASAKALAQQALIAKQWGRTDLVDRLVAALKEREKPKGGFDDNIYSDIPAYLALARAGYLNTFNLDHARQYLISHQSQERNALGSWGAVQNGTFYPDFASTCQAIQALAYLPGAKRDQEIRTAIDRGLSYLRQHQQADGSVYVTQPWADDPVVDTSEIIITLKLLGQDPASWKNDQGLTPIDYMVNKAKNPDGSFGSVKNITGAAKALHAYVFLGAKPQFKVPAAGR